MFYTVYLNNKIFISALPADAIHTLAAYNIVYIDNVLHEIHITKKRSKQ